MSRTSNLRNIVIAVALSSAAAGAASIAVHDRATPVLWRRPTNIASENLYYGPGGKSHAPRDTVFTFVKEDLDGSNPKFVVKDSRGVRWKVKLGAEAQPETVATRLLWAVGYTADEDYFLPAIEVKGLPRLHRGNNFVSSRGVVHDVRLERHRPEKKVADWKWNDNPFEGQRELNALRAMMALMNNWDLKDINNGVLESKHPHTGNREQVYMVTDVGASFGSAGFAATQKKAKGNVREYEKSEFITKVTPEYVDFATPARPSLIRIFGLPAFIRRIRLEDVGKHVPRADARWLGTLLTQLSRHQIADAFRAAGYKRDEVNRFTAIVQNRIVQLERL